MANFFIGALGMLLFLFLYNFARKRNLKIKWWQWVLTVLGIFYIIFVLEVIVAFLDEGAPRAALVMGLMLGIIAMIWSVLLGRFIFLREK